MPPKVARRPAARGVIAAVAKGRARVRRGGAPAGRAVGRGVLRRPAGAEGAGLPDRAPEEEFNLDDFRRGLEVRSKAVPVELWTKGTKVILSEATYWEEAIKASGIVDHVQVNGSKRILTMEILGTQSEALIKWKGANPGRLAEVDLCLDDCGKVSRDGLVHCNRLYLWLDHLEEGWMRIAEGMEKRGDDELGELRKRGELLLSGERGDEGLRVEKDKEKKGSSSSESKKKKKKKRKKEKKAKDADKEEDGGKKEVQGTKALSQVFGRTGLDPKQTTRRRMLKRAKKVAKKKARRSSSSSSKSSTSGSSSSPNAESSNIFGEEIRVKSVWNRVPGALTWGAIAQMQSSLLLCRLVLIQL